MRKTVNVMTEDDVKEINWREIDNIEDMYMVINIDRLADRYKDAKYQLVKAVGGFGCKASSLGNAIYVQELYKEGETYRMERCSNPFIGVATEKAIEEWKQIYKEVE